ncbi:Uncharacterised protein [Bordetella pertussis]|nr:Uncharacterised protein [Bordetella pertussis]
MAREMIVLPLLVDRARHHAHQALARQQFGVQQMGRSERMVVRHAQHALVAQHDGAMAQAIGAKRQAAEGDIDRAVGHGGVVRDVGQFGEVQFDARMRGREFGHQRPVQLVESPAQKTDAQPALLAAGLAPAIVQRGLEHDDRRRGALAQRLAQRRERHAAAGAVEQRRAQRALQRLDGFRDGRLAHVQLFGGAAEVQLAGHGQETIELAQVHEVD